MTGRSVLHFPLCHITLYLVFLIRAVLPLVRVVLKEHFSGSFQKTTDVPPFPSAAAAERLPVL